MAQRYFVHYTAKTALGPRVDHAVVTLDHDLAYAEDIDALADLLRRQARCEAVAIHGWQPLRLGERPVADAPVSAPVQQAAPALILPSCRLEGDELVIRITTDTLLHSVTLGEQWPTDYKGEPLATIVDRPLFVQDIIHELLREDEQGATPLHRLFDQAAEDALEAGSGAVVLRDEDDDAEGEA